MGKLNAALAWAARGFPVFPLVPNGKTPLYEDTWYESATTDADTIRAMWTDPVLRTEHDYNIGMDCTGRVIFDIDVKEGKDGVNQYAMMGGTYDTLVVQTPSGGYHTYWEGPDSANAQDVANGIDIRSHHGFVVAPGSTIDGKPYKIVRDIEPSWVPLNLERVLREPYARREVTHTEAIDSEASIEAGRRFLESAPVAIQGQRGDETTFVTAARLVREFALSVMTAYSLMAEHWNERCLPPWQLDELMQKVENAAQYGTADLGRLDPSVQFRTVSVEPPPTVFEQKALGFGNALDIEFIPPRPWLVDRILMEQELTLLLAPGSAGKSSMSLALVAHIVMGLDFAGYRTHCAACKAIVYNGEDDKREQSRRLAAVCQSYNLDYRVVKQRILILDESDFDMKLVGTNGGRTAVANEVMITQLVGIASDPDVKLIVYDPLVDVHDIDESDNPQMNFVMKTMKRISREANVASLVLHHTSKAGSAKQEDRIGNVEIGRGASGISNKTRIAFTLLSASATDAENYGMQEGERHLWVRLDDAKMNFNVAEDVTWFRKEGVKLMNGDTVGVLKFSKLEKSTNHIRLRVAEFLISSLMAANSGHMPMASALALLKQEFPLWANKTDAQIKQQLEGLLLTPIEVRGQTLRVLRQIEGTRTSVFITLT